MAATQLAEQNLEHGTRVLKAVRPGVGQQQVPDAAVSQGPTFNTVDGDNLTRLDDLPFAAWNPTGAERFGEASHMSLLLC